MINVMRAWVIESNIISLPCVPIKFINLDFFMKTFLDITLFDIL